MAKIQNSKEALQSLTDKRKALESLIKIAGGIESQHSALNELALAARPSQEFPAKVVNYFKVMEKSLDGHDSTKLLQKLEKIEETISKSVERILALARVDINKLRDNEIDNIDVSVFSKFIDEFKRRTNTSLGLRLILKKRGLAIAPIQIPIKQETINAQIEALKEKENRCVKQIRSEIQSIIKDTQSMLKEDQLPDAIRKELENVSRAMEVNIEHLDKGGSVSEIPNVFEVIVLESSPSITPESGVLEEPDTQEKSYAQEESDSYESEDAQHESTSEAPKAKTEEEPISPKSSWWIFKKWLSSPWSTSWSSLKKKYKTKS